MHTDLDDADALAEHDPGGMLGALAKFPTWWDEGLRLGASVEAPTSDRIHHIVVAGMGGSGITGDVAAALLAPNSSLPITVVKDYTLPAFVDHHTLVLAVSYSGNTEETLDVVAQAMDRHAPVAAVSSGGRLAAVSKRRAWPLVQVPTDLQPRAALPYLSGGALGFLQTLGLETPGPPTASDLQQAAKDLGSDTATTSNPAKQWAQSIAGNDPVAYGWGPLGVAALRLKCQLEENAKIFARHEILPEANHNDLVPWGAGAADETTRLLLLRSGQEPDAVAARFDFLAKTARATDAQVLEHRTDHGSPAKDLLASILFSDHVSVYAALAAGIDPTPVDVITQLKKHLESKGRIKSVEKRLTA